MKRLLAVDEGMGKVEGEREGEVEP